MWTAAVRDGRDGQRYPGDSTDAEWGLIAPLIRPAKHGGRRRSVVVRDVMNGRLDVLETGCQWRHLPPCSTVQRSLMAAHRHRPKGNPWLHRVAQAPDRRTDAVAADPVSSTRA
jgi:transposase